MRADGGEREVLAGFVTAQRFLLGCLGLLILAACRSQPEPSPVPLAPETEVVSPTTNSEDADAEAPPEPAGSVPLPIPHFRWLGVTGEQLVVDHRWSWRPGGRLTTLHLPDGVYPVFSRSGERIAVLEEGQLRLGKTGAPLEPPFEVPVWVRTDDDTAPDVADVTMTPFWADEERLVVQQMTPYLGLTEVCRAYDVVKGTWSGAPCISGDLHQVFHVEPGPEGTVVVDSVGEGHPAISASTYSLTNGQKRLKQPGLNLYHSGPALMTVVTGGKRMLISSPCLFDTDAETPCGDVDEAEDPWTLFAAALPGEALEVVRRGLTPGAAPSPTGDKIAWSDPGRVCVSGLKADSPVECVPFPPGP